MVMISRELNMAQPLDSKAYQFPQKEKGCKNVFWAVLFFIFFIAIVVLGIYGFMKREHVVIGGNILPFVDRNALLGGVGVGSLAIVIFTVCSLLLLKNAAGAIIKCSLIVYAFMTIAMLTYTLLVTKSIVVGVLMGLSILFVAIYIYLGWSHIKFAEACLEIAITAFNKNPFIVMVPLAFSAIQIAFAFIWIASQFGLYVVLMETMDDSKKAGQIVQYLYYVFAFLYFWISLVFSNIVNVTCCAYICDLLLGKKASVSASFGLALRNIGAISMGSAILAFIKTLKMMADDENNSEQGGIISCIALVILSILEDIVEYLTDYAFVFVALYEKDFMSAAEDSWNLFKYRGFDMIVNDDFTGIPCALFSLGGAFISSLISQEVARRCNSDEIKYYHTVVVAGGVAFLVALLVGFTVYGVIAAYIKSIFVIFAQHPQILASRHPLAYVALVDGFNAMIEKNPKRYSQEII